MEPAELTEPPVDGTPVDPATTPVVDPPKDPPAADQPFDLLAFLDAEYADDAERPELDEAAKSLTADTIKGLPAEIQAGIRAIRVASMKDAAAKAKANEEREKAAEAREQKIREQEKAVQRRRAELNALATKAVKDPGAPPAADIHTPEGLSAHLDYKVAKAQAEAYKPLLAEREEEVRNQEWADFVERFPEFRDEKAVDAWNTVAEAEAAKNPRFDWKTHAELYILRGRAERAQSSARRAAEQRTTQRIASASASARSVGSGAHDDVERATQMNDDDAMEWYAQQSDETKARYLDLIKKKAAS